MQPEKRPRAPRAPNASPFEMKRRKEALLTFIQQRTAFLDSCKQSWDKDKSSLKVKLGLAQPRLEGQPVFPMLHEYGWVSLSYLDIAIALSITMGSTKRLVWRLEKEGLITSKGHEVFKHRRKSYRLGDNIAQKLPPISISDTWHELEECKSRDAWISFGANVVVRTATNGARYLTKKINELRAKSMNLIPPPLESKEDDMK